MMNKAKESLDEYLNRISFFGLLLDMIIQSSILYHFGVFLPADIRCVVPCILVIFNLTLIWMAKFI